MEKKPADIWWKGNESEEKRDETEEENRDCSVDTTATLSDDDGSGYSDDYVSWLWM